MKQPRKGFRLLALAVTAAAVIALSPPQLPGAAVQGAAYLPTQLSGPSPVSAQRSNTGTVEAAPAGTNTSNSVYFRETGHYLKDAFLNYWLMNGGLAVYGYPLTEEFSLNGTTVQYFERSRFEYNANSSRPWHVDLSNVGSLVTAGRTFDPATQTSSTPDRTYFEQTGHTLGGAFGRFWQASGGVVIFGYPISEEMPENGTTVQYFERARFEMASQGRVQIGHLGAELLNKDLAAGIDPSTGMPQDRPGYNMSFSGEATWFHADWNRVISLNKGWGNLPQDFVGRGLYAAAPADLNLYGRWARVTRGNRSIFVQFVDVIDWKDIPYVRTRGIVIDLGQEAYQALGTYNGAHYMANFDVFWPGEEP